MHIDIHNHYIPRNFFCATRQGREWYGARLEYDDQGEAIIILRGTSMPLRHSPESLRLLNISASPEERIQAAKEQEDIDMQALNIHAYFWNYHLDAKDGAAFCREVNEELAELQASYPKHFVGLAMLPWQDTTAALQEMEYAIKDLGLRAVCVATNINGRNLDESEFLPVFEAIASQGLFLFCHTAFPVLAQRKRLSRYAFHNTIGGPVETTLAIMSLIFGGVLDKCPNLKVGFCHGGGFAVSGVDRLTFGYHNKVNAHTMERPPADYLGQLYYGCILHNPDIMKFLVDHISTQHVLMGTDFPLPDGIVGGTVPWINKMAFLSEEDKNGILGGNAARLLGIYPS
ncbi:amidohydrolase family protein [Chloroflexota bacterium]